MTEVQFIESIGVHVRWFISGRKRPLKTDTDAASSNLLAGVTSLLTAYVLAALVISQF